MKELLRTTDPVLIGFVESLLGDAGIEAFILDRNISVLEGSIGIFPCRISVAANDLAQARRVLRAADLEAWLTPEPQT